MRCPLFNEYWVKNEDYHYDDYAVDRTCWETECAFYDKTKNQCYEVTKAQALERIAKELDCIARKK